MFIELKTVWKTLAGENQHSANAAKRNIAPRGINARKDEENQWQDRRRRVGVLFSKHKEVWNFIVLIGPGDDLMGFSIVDVDEKHEYPNTHLKGRLAKCTDRPLRLKDTINYIDVSLRAGGPHFVGNLARAIIWGWDEFLKELRGEILQVCRQIL